MPGQGTWRLTLERLLSPYQRVGCRAAGGASVRVLAEADRHPGQGTPGMEGRPGSRADGSGHGGAYLPRGCPRLGWSGGTILVVRMPPRRASSGTSLAVCPGSGKRPEGPFSCRIMNRESANGEAAIASEMDVFRCRILCREAGFFRHIFGGNSRFRDTRGGTRGDTESGTGFCVDWRVASGTGSCVEKAAKVGDLGPCSRVEGDP